MKRKRWWIAVSAAVVVVVVFLAGYAVGFDVASPNVRISPMATVEAMIDGSTVAVVYSRPYVRTREIFGALLPYGRIWRMGANEATTLSTEADLVVAGRTVPAGDYTLYCIPDRGQWTLVINRQTGQWGTQYDESQDLLRVDMATESTADLVEQFTIRLESATDGLAHTVELIAEWENTRARVTFELR